MEEQSEDSLLELAIPYPVGTFIYFLIRNKKVVYVGQTSELYQRLSVHRRAKDFDSYVYVPCPPERLNDVEGAWILVLKPEYNTILPPSEAFVHYDSLKTVLGITGWQRRKLIKERAIQPVFKEYYRVEDFK